jgi:hypothetical protein
MNYFGHGRHVVEDPYRLAGTAVPDWLSVVNRRVRARKKLARQFVDAADPALAAVACGIVQHHHDDDWFHRTRAFAELSWQFTAALRDLLPEDDGFRPSFLGHILVEILLDAALIEEDPARLDAYYDALESLAPERVSRCVRHMTTGDAEALPEMIRLFCSERFLYDYGDDAPLLKRLNHVLRRVRLSPVPDSLLAFLPAARQGVRQRRDELLAGEAIAQSRGESR